MPARRLMVVLAVLTVAGSLLLAAGPAAFGKENVTARLLTPLRVDAAPGEQLTVVWALAGTDEHGRRQPFNAVGVFARLLSATGGRPTIGFATPEAHPQGRYDAQVAVPEGGIGGVQIGLRGTSDVLFSLENDPFAAPAGGVAAGQETTSGRPLPTWLALTGVLALLGVLGAVAWRARWCRLRRRSMHAAIDPGWQKKDQGMTAEHAKQGRRAVTCGFRWGRQASNLRPSDHESVSSRPPDTA